MTSINPEKLTEPQSYDKELTIGNFESLPSLLQEEWLNTRQSYMEAMGWRNGNDYDDYDKDPATVHLLLQNDKDQITAGMRLTPRPSIESTLSWSMIPGLDSRIVEDINGPVWDLTRLVPGVIDDNGERMAAFAELFGAGLASNLQTDENPRWIFAITKPFLVAFKRYGIEFTPILGAENEHALLAWARPVERTAYLRDNQSRYPSAHASVELGLRRSTEELSI